MIEIHPGHLEMIVARDKANAATDPTLADLISRNVLNHLFPLDKFPAGVDNYKPLENKGTTHETQ